MTVGAGNTDEQTLTGAAPAAGPPAAALHPDDPRRLGAYRLLGRLGEGGMGTVFLGSDAGGRRVAVKVIRAEYARDEQFRARFRAEAHAAQRVARFCTAQVLDVGTEAGLAYLVTEYIDGPTLSAAVVQDGPMRGSMLDSLAIGVAAALNGIHAAGVVHRDLKPSNVLLSRVGPKVIDFGIARALDAIETLTGPDQLVGTPSYMAPEQFRGAATAATDVFTWGSVVTFAGTGRPPFGVSTPYELMRRATTEEPDLDGIEPPLRDLVARAMSKEPERRPTARALLLALVGEADDPVRVSTRILSSTWTPPAAPPDPAAPDPAPARLAPTRVAEPRTRRRFRLDRQGRARLLAAVAVVAVVLVGTLLALSDRGRSPGGTGAQPDGGSTSTPGQGSSPTAATAGATPGGPGGTPVPVALGTRIPATGAITLGIGEVHRYRFRVPAARAVYLKSEVQGCAHLVPWAITRPDGTTVARNVMSCHTDGPIALPAGEYELRVGGDRVDGKYAFELTVQ